jgi:hypothetical protein
MTSSAPRWVWRLLGQHSGVLVLLVLLAPATPTCAKCIAHHASYIAVLCGYMAGAAKTKLNLSQPEQIMAPLAADAGRRELH